MDAIRIENLTKQYKDVVAVDHLSLTVGQGELFS
jgi:ABC-type multidrug transport system ATPase subunit